jgi:microcystin-dependent protein
MRLILPYNIINDTPADAVQVDSNNDVIADFVNSQVINRDGSVSMDAPLLLKGDPTEINHAANKGYVDAFFPVGVMMPFGGTAAPAGQWLLCDGASKSTTTYAKLFNVLGYRYGGSGGNFNLPDMRGRFPIGMDSAQTEFNATGKKGGSFIVPIPLHKHAMAHTHPNDHDHADFDSGQEKTTHVHPIDHDHPNTAATVATSVRSSDNPGGTNSLINAGSDGTTASITNNPVISVNVAPYDGNSGVETTKHVHPVKIPPYVGKTGATSVTHTSDVGNANVELQPPFVVVNYIIRAA